jgi:hypothetical protein
MDMHDLLKNIKTMTSEEIERKFYEMIHDNYHYKNLSEANRDLVMNFIMEYKDILKEGREITSIRIREDMDRLHEKRLALNLSEEDFKDIKEVLEAFRS